MKKQLKEMGAPPDWTIEYDQLGVNLRIVLQYILELAPKGSESKFL